MNSYKNLLSPLPVGGVTFKNRICYANANPHFTQGPEAFPAEGFMTFYTNIAKSCAYITLSEWNDPEQHKAGAPDGLRMQSFDTANPPVHNYFSQLADDIHFYGCKLSTACSLKMPAGYSFSGGKPKFMLPGFSSEETKQLPVEMFDEVIENYIEDLKKYRECGYDMVSLMSHRLFSPFDNTRTDEYGAQNPQNAARFVKRLLTRVKEAFGPDFLTETTVYGEQDNAYGIDYMVDILKELEGCLDVVFIKEKDAAANHPTGYNFTPGHHPCLGYAKAIRESGNNVIIAVNGGFQDPDEMEGYLAQGLCDMFGMARGLIADEDYMKKVTEGRPEDITPCLWCNKCHGTMGGPWLSVCSVNPVFGNAHKLHRLVPPAGEPKKVAVIGGGPVGMRTAITAAERGHSVTLYEKSDYLGGQLFHSDYSPFKWPLREFKNWLVLQLGKTGVNVVMNTEPTPDMIRAGSFDAVIAATGAASNIPNISGLKNADGSMSEGFMACLEVYGNEDKVGQRVVIVGGSETGTETGMYLAGLGRDVTVLTRQAEIAHDAAKLHYITMAYTTFDKDGLEIIKAAWELYDNFTGITLAETLSVTPGSVTYRDGEGSEHILEADSVIICGGMNPLRDEALRYYGATDKFFMAGDCEKVSNLQTGMRAAYARAVQV